MALVSVTMPLPNVGVKRIHK